MASSTPRYPFGNPLSPPYPFTVEAPHSSLPTRSAISAGAGGAFKSTNVADVRSREGLKLLAFL